MSSSLVRFGRLLSGFLFGPPNRGWRGDFESSVRPLVTVVTVSYNSLGGLRKTNQSLVGCKARGWETVVVDALSQDGTHEFLRSQECVYETIVEEKDSGIFDAMNKGIAAARGRYLLFMNCGDRLFEDLDWDRVNECLNSVQGVHMGSLLVDGGFVATVSQDSFRPQNFVKFSLPHQSAFIPKVYFDNWGSYEPSFQLYGDQEWFLRSMCGGASFFSIGSIVARYEGGGRSEDSRNRWVVENERRRALILHLGWAFYQVLVTASRLGWDELCRRLVRRFRRVWSGFRRVNR